MIGGIATSAKRVVTFLSEAGFDITVILPIKGFPDKKDLNFYREKENVVIYRFHAGPMFFHSPSDLEKEISLNLLINYSKIFIKKLDNLFAFDIYHAFFLPLALPIIKNMEYEKKRKPVIASVRGAELERLFSEKWSSPCIKEVLKKASYITTINSDSLSLARSVGDVKSRSELIPNSIDVNNAPEWVLTKQNKGIVGTIGSFRNKKNIPLLIKSYSDVNSKRRKKLLLVGDFKPEHQNEKQTVLSEVEKNDVADEFEITGFIAHENLAQYLLLMNIFVICSKEDGFPNTLLEALRIGVPIIASNVGAMKDILNNEENALVINPNDRESLTKAINSILANDPLANKLSVGARKLCREFNINREKSQWINIYNKLLNDFMDDVDIK